MQFSEEYGFRDWYAELTEQEYLELLFRWETMRGLHCSVPVIFIIPQAKELDDWRNDDPSFTHRCHIHEYDDSFLDGSDYQIPKDNEFWIDGKIYLRDEFYST